MASEINGVAALARLRSRSCIIDGEAVACGDDGIACFELIRRWDSDQSVFMWAFDLIELDARRRADLPLRLRLVGNSRLPARRLRKDHCSSSTRPPHPMSTNIRAWRNSSN